MSQTQFEYKLGLENAAEITDKYIDKAVDFAKNKDFHNSIRIINERLTIWADDYLYCLNRIIDKDWLQKNGNC